MQGQGQRRVVVFGLGGTIAMAPAAEGGVTPTLSPQDLVRAVPGLADSGIAVEVVDFRRLPSASLDFPMLTELVTAAAAAIRQGAAGVVVTQGTDTIEETSFVLDLYHRDHAPIVVTGAMRYPSLAGADGPANLLAAVRTAADPQARGFGALVVLNDEIHAARWVRKTHTTAVSTFRSPDTGPVGHVVEGEVRITAARPPRLILPPPGAESAPIVAIHPAVLGDEPAIVDAVAQRADGLVVAGMGAGHVPEVLVEPLAKAAERIPVVLASRVGSGSVLRNTYAYPGSERDLFERGLVPAGRLDPLKARVLLRGLLAGGADRSQIGTAFAVAGEYVDGAEWPWPAPAGEHQP
jgi:L-asparaginase